MNNTTNLALATVAIFMAATLVVGTLAATTTTLTQSTALAYSQKKKDNGKGNDNGNTITIQKCKQAATQSGFDNDQGQECENLICTHPGENATCVQEGTTVAAVQQGNQTTPATGTLRITKMCSPIDFSSCVGVEFPITVTGNNPQPRDFTVQLSFNSPTITRVVTLGPGSFTVTESVPPGFVTPIFVGNCDGTISAGQSLTCTIINAPSL